MKLNNSLFSIEDYNETHLLIKILGIKIKLTKREFAKLKKETPFYYYKKNNIDITTIPPATGQIRDIQLANLALLKEFDYVCKQSGLKYWLDFGTLIGAVRHKGYIPWDDDIDVSMLRDDYEKVIDAFEKYSRDKDIYAQYEVAPTSAYRVAIKIKHRKCPVLFVDVFPDDLYGARLSEEERLKITDELKKQWKALQKDLTSDTPIDAAQEKFNNLIKSNLKSDFSNSDILMGMDFYHTREYWLYANEMIFPLADLEFEGCKFPAVHMPDEYLTKLYGDYMAYPTKMGFGHGAYAKLSKNDIAVIQTLIKRLEK